MAKSRKSPETRIGCLPPRYSFALNPHKDARFSKCPQCNRATYSRKFPLLIHIRDFGPIVLGKTCRYCPKCEFIIAHQHELEHELVVFLSELEPEVVGNDYLVLGIVEKRVWRQGLTAKMTMEDALQHTADIKHYMKLMRDPGGWRP